MRKFRGVLRGRIVELLKDPGLPDGTPVEVVVDEGTGTQEQAIQEAIRLLKEKPLGEVRPYTRDELHEQ